MLDAPDVLEYVPSPQGVQIKMVVAAGALDQVPATQGLHAVGEDAAVVPPYVPGWHCVQLLLLAREA